METEQHNESPDVEEAAFEAVFEGSPSEEQPHHVDPPQADENLAATQVDSQEQKSQPPGPKEEPLTRAELQSLLEKQQALEAKLSKLHDTTSGTLGGLKQQIEAAKNAVRGGRGISQKAKDRLVEEFPELAEILFEDGDEEQPPQEQKESRQQVDVESLVKSRLNEEITSLEQEFEKKLLKREHKDWESVVASDGFRSWAATLPVDEQQTLTTTWDSGFISDKLSEYKSYVAAQEKKETPNEKTDKTDRLVKALRPKGTPRMTAYEDDDEEAAMLSAFNGS